jgi:hypothetical protein
MKTTRAKTSGDTGSLRKLAHPTDKIVRQKGLKLLRRWMSKRGTSLSYTDYMKLWKALWFCKSPPVVCVAETEWVYTT